MRAGVLISVLILGMACGAAGAILFWPAEVDRDLLFQVSTIDSVMAGCYNGTITIQELRSHGDTGIGTTHGLDGELIAEGGRFYLARASGEVILLNDTVTVPYASVSWFEPDLVVTVDRPLTAAAFDAFFRERVPSADQWYLIRAEGRFRTMCTRSIPPQHLPYPPLPDAAAEQKIFFDNGSRGVLVGVWSPNASRGIAVPGSHFHYLDKDRMSGGHVLDFVMDEGRVEIDATPRLILQTSVEPGGARPTPAPGALEAVEGPPG
ncbi:MAG: acetolactate decarboxylase [Methanomicrobiales archaeon]